MPDPVDLLAAARLLAAAGTQPASDAQRRRAISTAYYAVFHNLLRAAANRFVGPDKSDTAGYVLIYRGFDHRRIRAVCEAVDVPVLRDNLKRQLRRTTVSQDMREFARAFSQLQDARNRADYDPGAVFTLVDVQSRIDSAGEAIQAFNRIAADEQADVLALMLVPTRS